MQDLDLSVFDDAKIVAIGSMFALKKLDGHGMRAVLERARTAGAVTTADTKFDAYKIGFEGIRKTCPFIDFFLPSYEEALYLTSEREPSRQCDVLIGAGCGNVLIKMGPQGCFLADNRQTRADSALAPRAAWTQPARVTTSLPASSPGLNRGMPPEEAARLGSGTAAVSIQEVGSNGGVRSYDQVVEHMRSVGYA